MVIFTLIPRTALLIVGSFLALAFLPAAGQGSKYWGAKPTVAKIPPKEQRIRVIFVSDATNEIDDVWALSLALLYPERFDIEGFVGSNYEHPSKGVGPESIKNSVREIHTILEKAGMKGKFPVYPGAQPMQYEVTPGSSEGVDFIVDRAMAGTPKNPLWIVGLGSSTDLASAYMKQPAIRDRVVFFWHARTHPTWPYRAHNYNVKGDMHAARMLFHSPVPLVLFDTGTHLTAGTLEESAKYVKPYGELGKYLYDYRLKEPLFADPKKGFFDMGDVAVLIDPALGKWEETQCPTLTPYMDYNFNADNGKLLRCYDVDRDSTFQLLYDKLKANFEATRVK